MPTESNYLDVHHGLAGPLSAMAQLKPWPFIWHKAKIKHIGTESYWAEYLATPLFLVDHLIILALTRNASPLTAAESDPFDARYKYHTHSLLTNQP